MVTNARRAYVVRKTSDSPPSGVGHQTLAGMLMARLFIRIGISAFGLIRRPVLMFVAWRTINGRRLTWYTAADVVLKHTRIVAGIAWPPSMQMGLWLDVQYLLSAISWFCARLCQIYWLSPSIKKIHTGLITVFIGVRLFLVVNVIYLKMQN